MSETSIDPALVGIWIAPGQPQTYEIAPDGTFFVAGPEEPVRFDNAGRDMIWGTQRYARIEGLGETPVGRWREDGTGDIWKFDSDGVFRLSSGEATHDGIWVLSEDGRSLWTRELRARLRTDGAHLVFDTVYEESYRYGYIVRDGTWRILDPADWSELLRYVSAPKLMAITAEI